MRKHNPELFYQESQSINFLNLLVTLSICLTLTLVLGYIYAVAVAINPIIYLTVVLCVGFGLGLGLLARLATRLSKNRNKKSQYVIALFIGLMAFYFQWSVYILYAFELAVPTPGEYFAQMPYILDPRVILEVALQINEVGLWGIGEVPLNGFALTAIWLIEFIILVGLPIVAIHKTEVYPFSEVLNKWFPKYTIDYHFEYIGGVTKLIQNLQEDVISTIENLGPGKAFQFSRIHIFHAKGEEQAYLSIEKIRLDEKSNEQGYMILNNFIINPIVATELLDKHPHRREKVAVI